MIFYKEYNMMKLLSKTISANEETFAPEMTITVGISLNDFVDLRSTLTTEKYHEFIGKTLIDILNIYHNYDNVNSVERL